MKNVVVEAWREWASPARVLRTRELVRSVHNEYPDKVAVLVRVMAGCGAPDPRALRSFSRFLHEVENEVQGVAVVLEGDGFWAASMRAIVSSVTLMTRSGPPLRVYGDLREASEAICDLLGEGGSALVSAESLVRAATELGVPEG
ncbi:MAG: hypothetical protein H5U40_01510 [Polyangiaceae bacterium]|nr:hypothetical protein [Polyangiaceae bacterium]